nr:unnamed protein product [Callosobruchus chinensis]CAH7738923.1 unnamed protein product [Callosobruchus chinensis]
MPTRNQTEFERSLIEALRSNNIANAISEAIITNITKKLAEKFNYYDAKIASLEAEIQLLKSSCNNTTASRDDSSKIERKVDVLQQQAKNNNIRLMGVKESPNENTLVAVKKIISSKLKINPEELDNNVVTAYRVGQKAEARPRHIIVAFRDNQIKHSIYAKKKMLKGSQIVMKEDLTVERMKIVKEASEKYGFKNVWTFNGNIFVKTDNKVEKYLYNITDH